MEEKEEDANKIEIEQKTKLTKTMIEEIKEMQEQDLFQDIQEVKNNVKLNDLQNQKTVSFYSSFVEPRRSQRLRQRTA